MRVLILFAFLACAAAAPSGLLAPVAVPVYGPILPTISPGDLQAAAIDAQVKAQDYTIAAVDKARELSEQAVENVNEKTIVSNDQVKEKTVEEFWSAEEKKWQALDALKTAEAKIDGTVASNAELLAKSAISPYIALSNVALPNLAVAPIIAPIAPIQHTPGIVAPVLKLAEEAKAEEPKEEKTEALVKSTMNDEDSVAVDAKTEEKSLDVKSLEAKPLIAAPLIAEAYKYPIVAPVVIPQVLKYGAISPFGVQAIVPQTIGLPTVYNTPLQYQAW